MKALCFLIILFCIKPRALKAQNRCDEINFRKTISCLNTSVFIVIENYGSGKIKIIFKLSEASETNSELLFKPVLELWNSTNLPDKNKTLIYKSLQKHTTIVSGFRAWTNYTLKLVRDKEPFDVFHVNDPVFCIKLGYPWKPQKISLLEMSTPLSSQLFLVNIKLKMSPSLHGQVDGYSVRFIDTYMKVNASFLVKDPFVTIANVTYGSWVHVTVRAFNNYGHSSQIEKSIFIVDSQNNAVYDLKLYLIICLGFVVLFFVVCIIAIIVRCSVILYRSRQYDCEDVCDTVFSQSKRNLPRSIVGSSGSVGNTDVLPTADAHVTLIRLDSVEVRQLTQPTTKEPNSLPHLLTISTSRTPSPVRSRLGSSAGSRSGSLSHTDQGRAASPSNGVFPSATRGRSNRPIIEHITGSLEDGRRGHAYENVVGAFTSSVSETRPSVTLTSASSAKDAPSANLLSASSAKDAPSANLSSASSAKDTPNVAPLSSATNRTLPRRADPLIIAPDTRFFDPDFKSAVEEFAATAAETGDRKLRKEAQRKVLAVDSQVQGETCASRHVQYSGGSDKAIAQANIQMITSSSMEDLYKEKLRQQNK